MRITRRSALLGLGAAATIGRTSLVFAQANTARRFVVVLLRGALDGLAAVTPYGDPNLRQWRAELVAPEPGSENGLHDLGGFWGLHPALSRFCAMYRAGELLPVHAVAGPNRSRSHFEAQDMMEVGANHRMISGWLNRVAGLVPASAKGENAIAVGDAMPLLLRGPAPIATWAPSERRSPQVDFYANFAALHAADPLTGPIVAGGLRERGFSDAVLSGKDPPPAGRNGFPQLAQATGRLLAAADGPRLAAIDTTGDWDTHNNQVGRLSRSLAVFDEGMAGLRAGLGEAWAHTVVLVMTEFGRTVRINGTHGTDHGTASVAFVLGGPIVGGRVKANWPGLGERQLFEDRDLQPTTDVRGIVKGLLTEHLSLDSAALATVFPDSADILPIHGLLRA